MFAKRRLGRLIWAVLCLGYAGIVLARPLEFAELEWMISAQPQRGKIELEKRIAETRDARELRWLRRLRIELEAQKDPAAANAAYSKLEAEARQVGDWELCVDVVLQRSLLESPDVARERIEALHGELSALGIRKHESRLRRAEGVIARRAGDVDLAAKDFEAAIALGQGTDEAAARSALAQLQVRRGRFVEAIQNYSRAMALYQEAKDQRSIAHVMRAMAGLYLTLHDFTQAESMAVDMLVNLPPKAIGGRVTGFCVRARALIGLGDRERSLAHARAAVALAESEGGIPSQSEAHQSLAGVLIFSGIGPDAVVEAKRSLTLSMQVDGSRAQLEKRLTLAAAHHAAGEFDLARDHAHQVLEGARRQRDNLLERDTLELMSRIQLALGDAQSAFALRLQYEGVDADLETALASRQIADQIAGMERKRQLDAIDILKKDNEIKRLEVLRGRWSLFGSLAIAAFVAIAAAAFWARARHAGQVAELTRRQHQETTRQHQILQAVHQSLESSARELDHLANHDVLTGLLNRRALLDRLKHGWVPGAMTYRAFILIDIDHFKAFNDQYGHHAGDRVLAEVASNMRHQLRASDLIARWGGEEFLVVCSGHDQGELMAIGQRLLEGVRALDIEADGQHLRATISLGMAWCAPAPSLPEIDDLLRIADAALYRAKRSGRDRLEADRVG